MHKPKENESPQESVSLFTQEEKTELADLLSVLGMYFNANTVSDGEIIDHCEDICEATVQTNMYLKNGPLLRMVEKAQEAKARMMETIQSGPLIDLPVLPDEDISPYLARCSSKRRNFPLSVRAAAIRHELFAEEPGEELKDFNIRQSRDRENLRLCEKIIDLNRYMQYFMGIFEHISEDHAMAFIATVLAGKPSPPHVETAFNKAHESVRQKLDTNPKALYVMERAESVIRFYRDKLRDNGAFVRVSSGPDPKNVMLEMALKLGNVGQA